MPDHILRIRDSILELWNTGNAEIAKELYGVGGARYDPNLPEPARGSEQIASYVSEVRTAYPDFRVELKDTVSGDDRLYMHWVAIGTHRGPFRDIPPTGKTINISGMTLAKIVNGEISEERVYFDRLAMFEQLGVAPPAMLSQTRHATP